MQETQRRLHIGLGILNAVVISTFIYLIVSGLVAGRLWWLVLSPALCLPEIIRGTLEEFGSSQTKERASHRNTRRATKTLSVAGLLLMIFGIASM
jgi:1,4-dihydroxy-2-naphthoate octaprenyltransferase